MKDVEEFLNELTELTNIYKIVISGCGCCGSPFLIRTGDISKIPYQNYKLGDYLTYQKGVYNIDSVN